MPQELNGYGSTAGQNMGGTGSNLNERPDNSTPGGGAHGNGGGSGTSGSSSSSGNEDPYIRDSNGIAVGIKPGYHAEPSYPETGNSSVGNSSEVRIEITSGVNAVPDAPLPYNYGNSNSSGSSSSSGYVVGNWAEVGPVNLTLINYGIVEAINHGLPNDIVAATSTIPYKTMRAAFDALPLSQQPAARNQITQAWQKAHDVMPDTVTQTNPVGGNNNVSTRTFPNPVKWKQAQAISQVSTDIQNALNQHQEAERQRQAEAEAKAKLAELMARAGVKPTPVYTPEMVTAAEASLAATGAMVLNRASGMMQLSTVLDGVLTTGRVLAGEIAGALWRGVIELSRIATVTPVGATLSALAIGFWHKDAGLGSDQVPGRDIEMFAAQAQLFTAGQVSITPEMTSVNLPVRGSLVTENGRRYVRLFKTGVAGVPANVPVLRAVRDEKTGLDKITLPAVGGVPSRTILINPVPVGPTAPANTGNSKPAPVTPVHTGTTIKQADSIVTTTFPAEEVQGLQDFIYWQLDAEETGVEAIYVMLSGPPKSFTHGYKHYPPKGVLWKDIVKSTANAGSAKFKPDINIPDIDKDVWNTGQTTKKHPDWKVKQYDHIMGAYEGKETQWVVVKESQGVIHSHPISEQKAKEYIK